MNKSTLIYCQFMLGAVIGATIACSPTKFSNSPSNICIDVPGTCVVGPTSTRVVQDFKVGAGKVDILFVDDNSASMSEIQKKLAAKFAGFIEALDKKDIDYQIGITTTDITKSASLLSFGNGQKVLKRSDSNRVSLFNGAIVRTETADCEIFIKSAYESNPSNFDATDYYYNNYSKYCPSGDERGIYAAHEVLSKNEASLVRANANLNVIVISNEDVRSGSYLNDSAYALEEKDKASTLIQMINRTYPLKYWEFNSIITKDATCAAQQQQSFTGSNGLPIRSSDGNYVIGSSIGLEYAAVSSSASHDVDGNVAPRGQNLSICSNDYTAYFSNIAAKIADSARLLSLKCKPMEAPVVTDANGVQSSIPYSWNGDSQIIFQHGSEGIQIKIAYKCYTGVK
ncbi:MAG: VWA domain-containing protein [Bdellovibrionaceae bacterium]|nr:VWA domain-containing protein [Pseudobdellovibrionaceae bacterium]